MASLIICPSCGTRFETKVAIPPEGRRVRCSKCSHVWLAKAEPQTGASAQSQRPSTPQTPAGAPQRPAQRTGMSGPGGGMAPGLAGQPRPQTGTGVRPHMGQRPPQPGAPRPPRPMAPQGRPMPGANGGAPMVEGRGRGENGAGPRGSDTGYGGRPQRPSPSFNTFPEMENDQLSAPDLSGSAEFPADEGVNDSYHPDASFHGDAGLDYYEDERRAHTELVPDTRYEGGTPYVNLPAESKTKAVAGKSVMIGWLVLALVVLGLVGVFFGMSKTIAAALPGSTRIYAALGMPVTQPNLVFQNVHYAWNKYQGKNMLQVEGKVLNTTDDQISVPNVLIALLDGKGGIISEWMSPATDKPLSPGATTPFATQIPSPPDTTKSFRVSFQKPKS